MKNLLLITFLALAGITLYVYDCSQADVQAMNTLPKAIPFVCAKDDQIMEIRGCKESMNCSVILKSGRKIIYHAPMINEVVPCGIKSI